MHDLAHPLLHPELQFLVRQLPMFPEFLTMGRAAELLLIGVLGVLRGGLEFELAESARAGLGRIFSRFRHSFTLPQVSRHGTPNDGAPRRKKYYRLAAKA